MTKYLILTVALAGCVFLTGCQQGDTDPSAEWPRERRTTMNSWMVNDYENEAIANGVVAAHTLYPHHFVAYSAQLNTLGQRDLDILARHYRHSPGLINVRRAGTDDALYAARLTTVQDQLAGWGVDLDRITLDDGMPGGDGIASEFVVTILDKKMDQPLTQNSGSNAGFSNAGLETP